MYETAETSRDSARRNASSKSLMYAHRRQLTVNSWLYLWFWKAGTSNLREGDCTLAPFKEESNPIQHRILLRLDKFEII